MTRTSLKSTILVATLFVVGSIANGAHCADQPAAPTPAPAPVPVDPNLAQPAAAPAPAPADPFSAAAPPAKSVPPASSAPAASKGTTGGPGNVPYVSPQVIPTPLGNGTPLDPSALPGVPSENTKGSQNPYDRTVEQVFGDDVEGLQVMNDFGHSVRGNVFTKPPAGTPKKARNTLWYFLDEDADDAQSFDRDGDNILDDSLPEELAKSMSVVIFDYVPVDNFFVVEVRAPVKGRLVFQGRVRFYRGFAGGYQAIVETRTKKHQDMSKRQAEFESVKKLIRRAYWDMVNARFHTRISTDGRSVSRVAFSEKELLEAFVARYGVCDD